MKKYNFLIAGTGRSGKDTLAEILRAKYGVKFESSSYAAAKIFIYNQLKEERGYTSIEECYEDRHNHRELWYDLICWYNKDDKARLAKSILKDSDCYVGMRSKEELDKCKEDGVFSHVFWVDASKRVDYQESSSSCTVTADQADFILDNNSDLANLERQADFVWRKINEQA